MQMYGIFQYNSSVLSKLIHKQLLQLLKNKIGHLCVQVDRSIVSVDTVISIGIKIGIKLFIGLNECIGHFYGILEMYIIISHTMYQQIIAL